MNKILGLDLGTNSIGWALIDNETNKCIECGLKYFQRRTANERVISGLQRRTKQRLIKNHFAFLTAKVKPNQVMTIDCA